MSTLKNSKGGKKGLLSGSMQNMVIILAAVVLFLAFYLIKEKNQPLHILLYSLF